MKQSLAKKLLSQKYKHKQKLMSKMSYSESEPDFSNFVINLLSTFTPIFSESKSESDFSSVFMNLNICIFSPYIYTLLNKLADGFFLSILKTESIVMQAIQV